MGASFIGAMMDHIMEGMMIPKVQIERVVGPILSMFLEDVLTETLRGDPLMSGRFAMICPEFPFKKDGSRQSTNIDWLMYNLDRRQLVFLELKTSDSSVDLEQSVIYHAKQTAVRHAGGSFLIEDLKELRDASGEHGKYSYIIEKKVAPSAATMAACHDAVILYLVPRSAERKLQGHADKLLTFSMLSDSIPGSFAEEWNTIRQRLCALDESSKQVRNHKSDRPSRAGATPNFSERVDFRSIIELCRNRGDAVVVGFTGGIPALGRSGLRSLYSRLFKWDHAKAGAGVKVPANWIRGSVFLRIVGEQNVSLHSPSAPVPGPKRKANWQGTLSFGAMFDLCLQRGDEVVIGFTGGKEAFIAKRLSELQRRSSYKWDLAENMARKKRSDWLLGTEVIKMLKTNHGYPCDLE